MGNRQQAAGSGDEHEPSPETSAPGGRLPAGQSERATQDHHPINKPRHYVGRSGIEVIEITHAYRLGPDLTQAVQYILRAGRKTPDPREDLRKAAFYCRYAARQPMAMRIMPGAVDVMVPRPLAIAADFDLVVPLSRALAILLSQWPDPACCIRAAEYCEETADAWQPRAEDRA